MNDHSDPTVDQELEETDTPESTEAAGTATTPEEDLPAAQSDSAENATDTEDPETVPEQESEDKVEGEVKGNTSEEPSADAAPAQENSVAEEIPTSEPNEPSDDQASIEESDNEAADGLEPKDDVEVVDESDISEAEDEVEVEENSTEELSADTVPAQEDAADENPPSETSDDRASTEEADTEIEDDLELTDDEEEVVDESGISVESVIEAILFANDEPVPIKKLADIVESNVRQTRKCIRHLNERYKTHKNAFRIESIAGGLQMLTLPCYNLWLKKLLKVRGDSKLSPAGLETLAIIAYKQPVIRADIEAIRGVASGEMIRSLMYKGLVKIVGRAEVIGRPMQYGTTKKFLEVFGLNSIKDLPDIEELKRPEEAPLLPKVTKLADEEEIVDSPIPDEQSAPTDSATAEAVDSAPDETAQAADDLPDTQEASEDTSDEQAEALDPVEEENDTESDKESE